MLRLSRFLGMSPDGLNPEASPARQVDPAAEQQLVVVVEAGRKKIRLMVDELLGQQQVVVKDLEKHLYKVDGLMGATILGDGRVAPSSMSAPSLN